MNTTFNPQTLADDLTEVQRTYSRLFATLAESRWDKLVKGGSKEWTLHETVAHLCALNEAGLESIKHALRANHTPSPAWRTATNSTPSTAKGLMNNWVCR
jgi:hypothetical protein